MADLEAVLADVSYLMAMEKSKSTPAARASKKIFLPDPSIKSVMVRYLDKHGEITFEKIFHQKVGFLLFKDFCENCYDPELPVAQLQFYEDIMKFEKLETDEERWQLAKQVYDNYIMKELISQSHQYSKESVEFVQNYLKNYNPHAVTALPSNLFEPYLEEIYVVLKGDIFLKFIEREKFVRFCQWKNLELNIQLTMNDFRCV